MEHFIKSRQNEKKKILIDPPGFYGSYSLIWWECGWKTAQRLKL